MRSPDIQVEGMVIRRAAQGDMSEIDDAEFTPGRYNVFVLSDLPADFLTVKQHKLLVDAVKKGAGFMMLGGRSSFGAGGWAGTPIEDILPAAIHPGDGELEPPGGIKFMPTHRAWTASSCRSGPTRAETAKIWESLPPIMGTNRFGERKALGQVLATSPAPDAEPLMLSHRYRQEPHDRLRRRHLGLGPRHRKRAGSPIASCGGRSFSGCRTRKTTAKTTSS